MNDETWIRLTAPITPYSTQRLFRVIDRKYQAGVRKIHLLLSTPGGSVAHGIAIYNFLRGIPVEILTHNFGTVDSIGIIVFCAGAERYSVPHARFFLHPVGMDIGQPTRVGEHWPLEHSKSLKIDQENIARIIADTTQRAVDAALRDIAERKTLRPEEAKSYGLVDDIRPELLPVGADFVPVYESEAQPPAGWAGAAARPAAQTEIVAPPPRDSVSSIFDYGAPCS